MSIELREAPSVPPIMCGHNGRLSVGEAACNAAAKSSTGIAYAALEDEDAALEDEDAAGRFAANVRNFINRHGLKGEYRVRKRDTRVYIVQKRGER